MADIRNEQHWTTFTYRQRITREQLRTLLLEERDTLIRFGRFCTMKKKYLGAGVYEIWFEPKPFDGPEYGH